MPITHRIPASARITHSGHDVLNRPHMTSMQRDQAYGPLLPMQAEFSGPWRYATWAACFAVVTTLVAAALS